MNTAGLLLASVRSFPDARAVMSGYQPTLTYADLGRRVTNLAGYLRGKLRLARGDRVGLAMVNHPHFIEVMWACWHAGLVIVPMNAQLHKKEIAYILDHAGVSLCFATADLANTLQPLTNELMALKTVIDVEGADYRALLGATPWPMEVVSLEAPAWIFYTSGTTGRPKGAVLSHRSMHAMTWRYYADIDHVSPADSIIHSTALSHATGLFSVAFIAKAALHVIPAGGSTDVGEVLAIVDHLPRSSVVLSPTTLTKMAEQATTRRTRVENFKTILYGSAPIYQRSLDLALDAFGPCLWQGYGQGESPITITNLTKYHHADRAHPNYRERMSTVGTARTGVEVRIVDKSGQSLPAGEVGEIVCRSDVTMSGYWNNQAASDQTLKNGWLHTGDLGSLDGHGFLTLKDRAKDVIIVEGLNVYPREVEDALLRHPSVREVAVIGRRHELWGEEIVAFVVPANGAVIEASVLDRTVIEHIAPYKKPAAYFAVDKLPRNGNGKVLKTELRRRLSEYSRSTMIPTKDRACKI